MVWGSYPVFISTRHLSTPAQGANAYRLSWANAMDVSPQGSDPPVSSITCFYPPSFETKRQELKNNIPGHRLGYSVVKCRDVQSSALERQIATPPKK